MITEEDLGKKAKEIEGDFKGRIIGVVHYIEGTEPTKYCLTPGKGEDGLNLPSEWFVPESLELLPPEEQDSPVEQEVPTEE